MKCMNMLIWPTKIISLSSYVFFSVWLSVCLCLYMYVNCIVYNILIFTDLVYGCLFHVVRNFQISIWKSQTTVNIFVNIVWKYIKQNNIIKALSHIEHTLTLTKRLEKKLDGNYTRMLRAILNKSWQQHPARHQLYGHLPPITKTIQVRRTRHARHCWRSKDELVSVVLLWTPAYGQSKAGRPAQTYTQQLCDDTGCNPEDLPKAMNDRETWRVRVRDIRASHTTWWW